MQPNPPTGQDFGSGGEIFVSYAIADKALAGRVSQALKNAGHDTWVDIENIRYADHWQDAIFPAIARAPAVLFICSKASFESRNCREELSYAESLQLKMQDLSCLV